jgi:hypothetical protein
MLSLRCADFVSGEWSVVNNTILLKPLTTTHNQHSNLYFLLKSINRVSPLVFVKLMLFIFSFTVINLDDCDKKELP